MGRYNFTAARVHRATESLLSARPKAHHPRWFPATSSVPPPEILTRPLPTQHSYEPQSTAESSEEEPSSANFASYPNPSDHQAPPPPPRSIFDRPTRNSRRRQRPPKSLFQPQQIDYQEDALRSNFFTDHPWELARPRTLIESSGNDHAAWDWNLPMQPGRPVNGESVIQRQQYLMQSDPSHTQATAYDQARKEFYAQRHREQVEQRVAREEADAVGATGWGKTANEVGMLLEGRTFEQFRAWAEGRAVEIEQTRSASSGGGAESARAPAAAGPDLIEAEAEQSSSPADPGTATVFQGAKDVVAPQVPNTNKGQTARGGALFTT